MRDLNPLNLFTRQVLWPVELIRQWLQCGAPGGNRAHDRHVISVPHLPSVFPALRTSLVPRTFRCDARCESGVRARGKKYPWRD
jgi:hypothetical protein